MWRWHPLVLLVMALSVSMTTAATVEPIPTTVDPPGTVAPLLLVSAEDPLMTPGEEEYDPLNPKLADFVEKNSWKKGQFRFTPYGFFQGNISYNTNPATRFDYVLFVNKRTGGNRPQFDIDVKLTRLGLIVEGPESCFLDQSWRTAGQIEFDFRGQFLYPNTPGVRFRRGFIELENQRWRLLFGQEWDVISPLLPRTVNTGFGYLAGNLGYRRPQLRAERTFEHTHYIASKIQFSINQSTRVDGCRSSTDDIIEYDSKWPVLQGRYSWTLGQRNTPESQPAVLGISGHVGQENYDFLFASDPQYNVDRPTWSGNVDLNIPITSKLTFRGEFFFGENLALMFGGINQGINPYAGNTIRSIGGWLELGQEWNDQWRSYCGWSIDDPNNRDLSPGMRSRNKFIYANTYYNITKNFMIGMEVSWWQTAYLGDSSYDLARLEWMARYRF